MRIILTFFCLASLLYGNEKEKSALELPAHLMEVGGATTSRVQGSPEPPLPYTVEKVWPELAIPQLIGFKFEPGTDNILYIDRVKGEKGTRLRRFDPETLEAVTLLAPNEMIYDIAFHPNYENNGFLYLGTNGPADAERGHRRALVIRYTRKPNGTIDPESGYEIIKWPSNGHNGTALVFGSDGMFYVTSGDGTPDSDTDLTGQRLDLLNAKVLRIDVDNPAPGKAYSVPSDNPFVDHPDARPETYAYGFRNPWRASWDPNLDRLWVGQNGQDRLEQVYLVERGANYGWSVYEGSRVFYKERELGPTPVSPPTFEHGHHESRSLTGGVVYTGDKLPDLKNAYVYGDYTTGKIWAGKHDGEKVTWHREIADTILGLTDFVNTPQGDLWISSYQNDETGGLYRLVPKPPQTDAPEFPTKLSETGLFSSVSEHKMQPELFPYSVNVPKWADGAEIERYLAMPAGDPHIGFSQRRGWNFSDGAVALQSLSLNGRRIETRVLTRQQGEWVGYSYAWNKEQTDAELVPAEGMNREIGNLTWKFESRANCMICHSRAANFLLGVSTEQMNRVHDYGDDFAANQLQVIDQLGFFTPPGGKSKLRKPPAEYEALVDPFDSSADLDARARSYLHARCAHCHVESGGGNAMMDLRYFVDPEKMLIFNETPNHGTQELGDDAKLVVPGNSGKSVLFHRISQVGPARMPPMGSAQPDPRAVPLVLQWIQSLESQ